MKKLTVILLFVSTVLFVMINFANAEEPAHITVKQSGFSEKSIEIVLNLNIKDGWNIYSNIPSSVGMPFKIRLKDLKQKKILKNFHIKWPDSKKKFDYIDEEEMVSYIFSQNTAIPIEIYNKKNTYKTLPLGIDIEYVACSNICTFHKKNLKLTAYFKQGKEGEDFATSKLKITLFIVILALLGGFIINLMPCVIPVVSLKVFHLLHYGKYEQKDLKNNLLFTIFGILTSFIILALITSLLKATGKVIGWGFHFQEPVFVMFLVIVMIMVSSNLWGNFEISLPSKIATKLSAIGLGEGYLSSFSSGVLITLLATPCTAPFLTTAVSYALSQSIAYIFLIYLCIGIGMSVPYILLIFKTNFLNIIPKPGRWIKILKQIFALLIMLNVIWLLYILKKQLDLKSLLIFIGLIIVFKKISLFLYQNNHKKLTLALLPCMIVFSIITTEFSFEKDLRDNEEIAELWASFNSTKLDAAIKNNKIVLVDITAEWCITCKINKALVLNTKSVLKFLQKNDVLLLSADYTNPSREVTNFLIVNNRHGIPFNIVYGPNAQKGIILSSLLTKKALINAIEKAK